MYLSIYRISICRHVSLSIYIIFRWHLSFKKELTAPILLNEHFKLTEEKTNKQTGIRQSYSSLGHPEEMLRKSAFLTDKH